MLTNCELLKGNPKLFELLKLMDLDGIPYLVGRGSLQLGKFWKSYRMYIILVIAILIGVAFITYQAVAQNYGKEIQVSFARFPNTYDFSCNTTDQELYVTVRNNGTKTVDNFMVSISNPLCVGALPLNLPSTLAPMNYTRFYVQSSSLNGTLTISGNGTLVSVEF